ncbi:hypothetical protein IQE94_13240 [Synechocystis sp. PCC 7339]|uniref:hypothetical protein n=1 Tax=Synechocystis sp. PCC 7339 TaxID=2782213 RepID=UPI001CBF6360|nr:hypothetical protein [Synechocystis sp. PCC 7339]UAJ72061.1 hypothetical protein IQE94_13240 [Synechocystis sp. PCC 7339]
MVKYALTVEPTNNLYRESLRYALDLTPHQENNPATIFDTEIKKSMLKSLKSSGTYKILPLQLEQIIQRWQDDIGQGYRETTIKLKLSLLIDAQINQVVESGYQLVPDLIEPDLSSVEPKGGAFPPLNFPL